MGVRLMAFWKKILFGANGPFMTQNSASCLATLDPLYGLFYSTLKVAKKDMEILIMVFLGKKILFRAIWSTWRKNGMAYS